jgi:hypothetical protein
VYGTSTKTMKVDKTVKMSKTAVKDNPNLVISVSERSIHLSLDHEIISGLKPGMKVLKGTYYCQKKLV